MDKINWCNIWQIWSPLQQQCVDNKNYRHPFDAVFLVSLQEDGDSVGFATLPEQVHRKAIKRGFDFTLMVVGTCRYSAFHIYVGEVIFTKAKTCLTQRLHSLGNILHKTRLFAKQGEKYFDTKVIYVDGQKIVIAYKFWYFGNCR